MLQGGIMVHTMTHKIIMYTPNEEHLGIMHMSLQIDNWNRFDVFQVGNLSKGKPLETVTLALFARHDLLEKLKIPYDRLQKFVRVSCLR